MEQQQEYIALTLGAGQRSRVLEDAGGLLRQYRQYTGADYQDYAPSTSRDHLYPEDLALTLLLNSQAGWRAVRSLCRCRATIDLAALPDTPLEQTMAAERQAVALLIARMAQWPGFGASLATKVLHKKRPHLVPILDNQAIFGAYMNTAWPQRPAARDTVKELGQIREALDCIAFDLARPENARAWDCLQAIEPAWTRIELFDSIWWMHFRILQPVGATALDPLDKHFDC